MRAPFRGPALVAVAASLAACGTSAADPAVSGAGIGAAAGGPTHESDFNPGNPVWR